MNNDFKNWSKYVDVFVRLSFESVCLCLEIENKVQGQHLFLYPFFPIEATFTPSALECFSLVPYVYSMPWRAL